MHLLKIKNAALFSLPFTVALIITAFVSVPGLVSVLSYFIILGMVLGAFIMVDFFVLYWRSKNTPYTPHGKAASNLRIAVLITAFNEDPKLVLDTSLSARLAAGKQGDVFILDDSTDEATRKQIDTYKEYGFRIIHRENRRGYKAGAVNAWLEVYGAKYDLMAIFDADQRPMPFLFDNVTPYFTDKTVAFVQVPQYYSEISSGVSLGAFYQQLPFLRLVMRGRSNANSAFSLGSGTVYRVKALTELGGLDDSTVTEDISTALDLHSKGWKSVYIDKPLVWYGMPPKNIAGYLVQQGRWSLGGFQLLGKILRSKLSASQFFDYINGWLYWFTVGPITLFEVFAPVIFLLFGVYFFNWNPLVYLAVYIPYFIASLGLYAFTIKKQSYGVRGFVYHHTVQLMASISVVSAFAGWLLRKKKPFAVTPKGENAKTPRRILLTYSAIIGVLALSAVKGTIEALTVNSNLWAAYAINLFWAGYFALFFTFGVYIIERRKPYSAELKVNLKPTYLNADEKAKILAIVYESVELEEKISKVYNQLAQKIGGPNGAILMKCSKDSAVHAKLLKQILGWLNVKELRHRENVFSTPYLESLQRFTPRVISNLSEEEMADFLQLLLETENVFNEEVYIELMAKIFSETLVKPTEKYEEVQKILQKIKNDEAVHTKLIQVLRDRYLTHRVEVYVTTEVFEAKITQSVSKVPE